MICASKWNFPCLITLRGREVVMKGEIKVSYALKRKEKAVNNFVSAEPCDELISGQLLISYKCAAF